MDQQLVQRTRYLLQTRFRRMRTAPTGNFELVCGQVLDWLGNHPILSAVLQHLDNVPGDHHLEIKLIFESENISGGRYHAITIRKDQRQENEPKFKGYTPMSIEEHVSACLQIIRASISRPDLDFYQLLAVYLTREEYSLRTSSNKNPLEAIKEIAIRDLYEYLDEHLDGINSVNGILQKYKQSAEWFQKQALQQIVENGYGGKTGERALALHLQQYVFDQGVEFTVEPTSASGEVDLLLRDPFGQFIIIDAKYVKRDIAPSAITRKIAEGFNQVARYCDDFNQPEGFLTVFVDDDRSILIDLEQNDGFRYFNIGGNIIYYSEINIAERPSASESGKARQIHITSEKLVEEINEIQEEAT